MNEPIPVADLLREPSRSILGSAKRPCENCGKPLLPSETYFCSKKCEDDANHEWYRATHEAISPKENRDLKD